MLSSDACRANLTDDEAQGGGDRHHGPGESHGGVVHCLGRAHDEATADPGGCITHAGNKSRNVSDCCVSLALLRSKHSNCVVLKTASHPGTESKGVGLFLHQTHC